MANDGPSLLIVVPTYNEEAHLESTVGTLLDFFRTWNRARARIVVADCSDRDRTPEIAARLAQANEDVEHHVFPAGVGKGQKVRDAVLARPDHDYYAFIDADLPITMGEFSSILDPVLSGKSNVAIASKYVAQGGASRRMHRVLLSRAGNSVLKLLLRLPVSDLLAGAKAWDRKTTTSVWPDVRNDKWFFDAEMIYLAHRRGLSVVEVPVHYLDHGLRPSKLNSTRASFDVLVNAVRLLGRK